MFFSRSLFFKELGLSTEVLNALNKSYPHISIPTEIQEKAIPAILKRKNHVVLASQTGTGKTLAYLLPLIHFLRTDEVVHNVEIRNSRPRALILVPNRELCQQISNVAKNLSHYSRFSSLDISGGKKSAIQTKALKDKVDLVITTPGRLIKHQESGRIWFTDVRHVVIDEADTMFAKDFMCDLEKILLPIEGRKNTLKTYHFPTQFIMACATLPEHTKTLLMKRFQNGQITFILSKKLHQCLGRIKQTFIHLNGRGGDKHDALLNVLKTYKDRRWIVFCNTIASCRSTDHFLTEQGFSCSCYHGGIPPKMREANWKMFLSNERSILICTDIGSRGLDTTMVEHVILFDFPLSPLDYLHRIGRTARAGKPGRATSLVTKRDRILAAAIQVGLNFPIVKLANLDKFTILDSE